jgi:hypothetical protein
LVGTGLVACSQVSTPRAAAEFDLTKSGRSEVSGYIAQGVTVREGTYLGRNAVSVELADDVQRRILRGAGGSNGPTFALTGDAFADGTIEVDVAGEINGKGAPDVRGFVGLAFHLSPAADTYEAVYLRMSNGTLNVPPPPAPRNVRAVQYVAHPDFHFNVSREKFPGRYEAAAPVALGRWHRLRLQIHGPRIEAFIDGVRVLDVTDAKYAGRKGRIGLWVDDGTRGYFSGLRVSAQ